MAEETKKEVSLLLEARNLLKVAPKGPRADILRNAVDQFQECYDLIKVSCTRGALRDLVGSATVLCVCISAISTPPANPPRAGSGELEASRPRHDEAVAPDRMKA